MILIVISDVKRCIAATQQEKPPWGVRVRNNTLREDRLALAHLPSRHDLDEFDFNYSTGINRQEMKELRELDWLDQAYNIILMGPSGTGKTFIAGGLVYEAVKNGRKAYMMTMEELVTIIKMKSISPTAMASYNRIVAGNWRSDACGHYILHPRTLPRP